MSTLEIQKGENNPILRKKSEEVADIKSPEIQGMILDMKETLQKVQGLGLAATQVGNPLRIFAIDKKAIESQKKSSIFGKITRRKIPEVCINPRVLKLSKEKELMEEGCLSLPGIWGTVERHTGVEIEALDEKGKKFKIKASGLLAQVFQHEIDHLEGILFIDKAVKIAKEKGLPENL